MTQHYKAAEKIGHMCHRERGSDCFTKSRTKVLFLGLNHSPFYIYILHSYQEGCADLPYYVYATLLLLLKNYYFILGANDLWKKT